MYLVFDIGGTKIRVGKSLDKKTVEDVRLLDSNQDFDKVVSSIKKIGLELSGGEKIDAIGGGSRGVFDDSKSIVTDKKILNWIEKPLKQALVEGLEAPVFLENDTSLATLGEAVFGAGKEKLIVAYLTISTGIGGGRVVDGKIDSKALGFEPGEHIIDITKHPPLTFEGLVSGEAIEKEYGKKPEEIQDEEVWDGVARNLAVGINNVLVFWSPDIVVLGGSVMKSINIEKVKEYTKEIVKIFPEIPPIEKAQLGDEVGLWGALAYLNQKSS